MFEQRLCRALQYVKHTLTSCRNMGRKAVNVTKNPTDRMDEPPLRDKKVFKRQKLPVSLEEPLPKEMKMKDSSLSACWRGLHQMMWRVCQTELPPSVQ